MKILSVAVPCYNSSAYMEKCIKSLLPGGEDIEILLVDDGSQKDNTLEILVMIIRAHVVFLTEHLICAGEIGYVTDDEEVMSTYRTLDDRFTFTG